MLLLVLAIVVPEQAFGPASMQAGQAPAAPPAATSQPGPPVQIPLDLFKVPDGFEVTLWAATPLLHNPTNMDIDRDGRIWVAEGVRYRSHFARQPEGDRIIVVQDTDGDGKADETHTFVQEPGLIAPLGVAVIDNKIIVSQPPDLIVYTDVDRNLRFDPAIDKREVLLTGFQGINHDHSLHSVTFGPDGKWIFNSGNTGAMFTDKSGKTFRIFGSYRPDPVGPFKYPNDPAEYAGKPSDDGHVYVGGFTVRMNPDGTNAEIIGFNYRNSYEQSVTSLGDVFQNDNDDPPACRVSWVMEYANFGFSSMDGQRTWQADRRPGQSIPVAEWRQDDPGMTPTGDVYGGGSPTGQCVLRKRRARAGVGKARSSQPMPVATRCSRISHSVRARVLISSRRSSSPRIPSASTPGPTSSMGTAGVTGAIATMFRPSDVAVGPDGALYVSDWIDARVGGHQDLDDTLSGAIYRIAPKGFASKAPKFDASTIEGQITALRSPAVNVRAIGFQGLKARGAGAVNAVAALLEGSKSRICAAARSSSSISLVRRASSERERRSRIPIPRCGSRRIERCAARTSTSCPWPRGWPRMPTLASAARWRCRCAISRPTSSLDILVDIARGYDGKDRSYLEALGTGATGKERRSTTSCGRRLA